MQLKQPHANQLRIIRDQKRNLFLLCGRGFGKTVSLMYVTAMAIAAGHDVGYFVPTYKLADEFWRDFTRSFAPIISYKNDTKRYLTSTQGGSVEVWTMGDPDAGRSRRYNLAIVDEAGKQNNIQRLLLSAIQPTLMNRKGRLIISGTPDMLSDTANVEHLALYNAAIAQPDMWSVHQYTSYDNPLIDAAEIDALKVQMEAQGKGIFFEQEVLARFVEGTTLGVYDSDVAVCFKDCKTLPKNAPAVAAIDAAEVEDSFACIILQTHRGVVQVSEVRLWVPAPGLPVNYRETYKDLRNLFKTYPNLLFVAYDPYQMAMMSEYIADDYDTVRVNQQEPRMRYDTLTYSALKNGSICIPTSERTLQEHMQHARRSYDARNRLRFKKSHPDKKIDALVALSMAYGTLQEELVAR